MNDNEYRLHELLVFPLAEEGISMRLGTASIDEIGNPANRNRIWADSGRLPGRKRRLSGGGPHAFGRHDVVEFDHAVGFDVFGGEHLAQSQGGMA